MIYPKALRPDDTIGILSPASPIHPDILQKGINFLTSQGFKVALGKHTLENKGFLAGSEEERLEDIHEMFANPTIKAIIPSRGGYGTLPLLDKINYTLIKENPKIFIGYSDITSLHIALGQRANLITFHGPMISELSIDSPSYNIQSLKKAITKPQPYRQVYPPTRRHNIKIITPGKAEGRLTGGNLSVLCSTLGTPYEIDCRGKILLLEEVGEPSYKIHRMLTQLKLARKLQEAAGFIIGEFTDCTEEDSYPLEDILQDFFISLKKPALGEAPCGHGQYKTTLPLGGRVAIEQDKIIIKETGVVKSRR